VPEAGVFRRNATYRAIIRFSNAFKVRHDLDRDARGMAIKLVGVEGQPVKLPDINGDTPKLMDERANTQDFLLVTHSEFFGATANEFLEIVGEIVATKSISRLGVRLTRCFFGLRPFRFRWRNAWALFRTFKWTSNPLYLEYFSQTPYRHGDVDQDTAVKFRVRPLQAISVTQLFAFWGTLAAYLLRTTVLKFLGPTHWKENVLRTTLHEYLSGREARFEFAIQLRTHPDDMPLDDATRRWSARLSPWIPVATICIPQNDNYRSSDFIEAQMAVGERLTYTPWHALEAHRPLGSINRARLFAYARMSAARNGLNGTDAAVPQHARAGALAEPQERRTDPANPAAALGPAASPPEA
jgi:hypothetical protein